MNKGKMIDWIGRGKVGVSSLTMWCVLMGCHEIRDADKPYDIVDFDYCYNMVKFGEVSEKELEKVSERFPWYSPYIKNWKALCFLFEKDDKFDFRVFICKLHDESDRIKHEMCD